MHQNKDHFKELFSTYNEQIEVQNEVGIEIKEASISDDLKYLATTHIKKTKILIIQNLLNKKIEKKIELMQKWGKMILLQFSKSNLEFFYSQQNDNSITIIDLSDLRCKKFKIEDNLLQVKLTQSELIFCSFSLDSNNCYFWNVQNGVQIKELSHSHPLSSIHYYKNDKQLITVSCSYHYTQYCIWDIEKSKVLKNWKFQFINPNCEIRLNEKQDLLIVYFLDEDMSLMQIWSLIQLNVIKTLFGVDECMIIMSIVGTLIISESEDETQEEFEGKLIANIFDIVTFEKYNVVTFLNQGDQFLVLKNVIIAGKRQKQKISSFSVYK